VIRLCIGTLRKFGAKTPFYPDNAFANGMAAIHLGKGIGDRASREHYRGDVFEQKHSLRLMCYLATNGVALK
jgi:hypothetical protein